MSLTTNDLALVVRETFGARNEWRKICEALGVQPDVINDIGKRGVNTDDCYRKGLYEWLRESNRNWSELVTALSDDTVRHGAIANKIRSKFVNQSCQPVASSHPETGRGRQGCLKTKWKKAVSIIVIVSLLGMVVLVPLVVFSSLTGTGKESLVETNHLDRNTTILISKQFNTQYYDKVSFTLEYGSGQEPDVITCVFDCTHSEPRLSTAFENHSSSSAPIRFDKKNRRYVVFRQTQKVAELTYLLGNSSMLFKIDNVGEVPEIQLFILSSHQMCDEFHAGLTNSSFRNFSLNEANNFTANFIVPSAEPPQYYCGIWEIDSSITFHFTVQASIVTYDVNFYQQRGDCHPISPNKDFTLNIDLTLQEAYKCVLLSQLEYSEFVSQAQVLFSLSDSSSPIFKLFISLAIAVFVVFLVFILFVLICIVCQHYATKSQLSYQVMP